MENLEESFKNASYLPNSEILTLSQLAIKLGKPILIEGPPGTGKTSLAKALANVLNTQLYRIQCYEGITAEQVIGEFNYQKQLLQIELNKGKSESNIFTTEFFIPRPLLQVLQAKQSVVLLLDEIDRADEEFEAFLLEALGENQVTIPELGTIHANSQPIVILTSNATRELSGALRRRSLFLALDYPSAERELEIVKIHVPNLEEEIYHKIVNLVRNIRKNNNISQPPSISETIELAQSLLILGKDVIEKDRINEILGLLVKNNADIDALKLQLSKSS
ncbi:MAG: MoxR family ATPase [Candidatus Heimdallarchaeota archaeon]|nr:MoxR family ATPase [Candidatus Heimdallarchaeota archaeon]MDH5646877.1 MoxR family ATPase [Candidatus Heimdallarchaeota archaeon]